MLRKMVFGPRGRLSTDLDFTRRSDIDVDDLMLMMLEALGAPYHSLSFRFDKDKDWYLTDEGCAANPVCFHDDNKKGVKIKFQVSTREAPVMPIAAVAQIEQDYFRLLPFKPAAIPSLAYEEAIAEKIRAASQRSKIRDLHDLSEIAGPALNRELIRSLAVIKLWNSGVPACFAGGQSHSKTWDARIQSSAGVTLEGSSPAKLHPAAAHADRVDDPALAKVISGKKRLRHPLLDDPCLRYGHSS